MAKDPGALKLLKNPEVRYGPLPAKEAASKLLEPRPDLQAYEGAMKYLDLHLNRVKGAIETMLSRDKGFWAFWLRTKAKQEFINTTRALRMIMTFHRENPFVLNQMALRLKEELANEPALALHYEYLLRLLAALGSREAEKGSTGVTPENGG